MRAFAAYLGVSPRSISKWERAGTDLVPTPDSQAILDTALHHASPEAQQLFDTLTSSPHGFLRPERPGRRGPAGPANDLGGRVPAVDSPVTQDVADVVLGRDGKPAVRVRLVAAPDLEDPPPEGSAQGSVELHAEVLLDVTPVTNAEYAVFVTATGHRHPRHWPSGAPSADLLDHPVVFVDHHDAAAYAAWAGKRLPTVEEWQTAAGGPQRTLYPWGEQPTAAKCNVRESGIGTTTPVRRYRSGVAHAGIYDLAGNVWEWCSTLRGPGRYALKGSAFTSPLAVAALDEVNDADQRMQDDDTGFRCAQDPA